MSEHAPQHYEGGEEANQALLDALVRQVRRLNHGVKGVTFRHHLLGGFVHEDGLLSADEIESSSQSLAGMSHEEARQRSESVIEQYGEYASDQATIAYKALDNHFHSATGLQDEAVHAGIAFTSAVWHETEYLTGENETISIAATTLKGAMLYGTAELFVVTRTEDTPEEWYATSLLVADGTVLSVWEYDASGWDSGLCQPADANYEEIADLARVLEDQGD